MESFTAVELDGIGDAAERIVQRLRRVNDEPTETGYRGVAREFELLAKLCDEAAGSRYIKGT